MRARPFWIAFPEGPIISGPATLLSSSLIPLRAYSPLATWPIQATRGFETSFPEGPKFSAVPTLLFVSNYSGRTLGN